MIDKKIKRAAECCVRYYKAKYALSDTQFEDLCIECAEYAHDRMHKYDPKKGSISTFASGLIRNHLRDWEKHEIRRRKIFANLNDVEWAELAETLPNQGTDFTAEDLRERVLEVLMRCEPETVHVCKCIMSELKFRKIAAEMGQSYHTFLTCTMPKVKTEFKKIWKTVQ